MTETLRVGIIGFGLSGSAFHAPVVTGTAGFALTAFHSKQAEKVLSLYPHVTVFDTAEKLIHSEQVDVVVITSPNDTHYPLAKAALLANKHVVVEKPFVIRSEQGYELAQLATKQGKILSVYQNRRWDSDFLTVKALLESKKLGHIHTFESSFDRYRPISLNRWREQDIEGSGILYDLGSHLIDQAIELFGTPDFVWADLQKQRTNAQAVDYFYIILGYTRQSPPLRVHLRSGCLFYRNDPRYTIHGTTGSFIKFGVDPQEDALRAGRIPNKPSWVLEPESNWGKVHTISEHNLEVSGTVKSLPGDYRLFYDNVRDAIHGKAPCAVTPVQASRVIRIIELALESAEKGANVKITFKED